MSHVWGGRLDDAISKRLRNRTEVPSPSYTHHCAVLTGSHQSAWATAMFFWRCSNLLLAKGNKSVVRFCFVAHDLRVLRFITLLWESLPLPLQRKMVTSRGKISHLTSFLSLLWNILYTQTSFVKNEISTHILITMWERKHAQYSWGSVSASPSSAPTLGELPANCGAPHSYSFLYTFTIFVFTHTHFCYLYILM